MNVCCNPFNKTGHSSKKKNLKPVLPWMLEKIPSIVPGAKIYDSCKKELVQLEVESDPFNNSSNELDSTYLYLSTRVTHHIFNILINSANTCSMCTTCPS